MTVVHNHPHPKAMTVVKPSNEEIFKKFGMVRIEDWDDRIHGTTWQERLSRGSHSEASAYLSDKTNTGTPRDMVNEVVACHTITTGERVLLHNDWLQ